MLPVLDAEDRLVGVVSEADLLVLSERLDPRAPARGPVGPSDHRGGRRGLRELLEATDDIVVVGESGSAREASRGSVRPDDGHEAEHLSHVL